MAPPSSLPDRHEEDILELINRLFALEYERGKLTAQLEFHLRVRTTLREHPQEPLHVVTTNGDGEPEEPEKRRPGRPRGRVKRKPGELQDAIIEDLAKCGALSAREIAHHVEANQESVRQTISRLIAQAKVERASKRKYRLARTNHEPLESLESPVEA